MIYNDTCDCCGTSDVKCYPVASIFGAFTNSMCEQCLSIGRFPYWAMVNYIACAGKYPEEINDTYKKIVSDQLKLHNKTEEQFIEDVNDVIADIISSYNTSTFNSYNDKFDDYEGDFF